jgi:tetratricopeptide (TPR) repeat protein
MQTHHSRQQHAQLYQMLIEADKLRLRRRFKEAIDVLNKVLEIDSTYFLAYYKLALYYYQKNDELRIFRCLKTALRYCDDLYWYFVILGYIQEVLKELTTARQYYLKAIMICNSWNNRYNEKRSAFDAYFNLACASMDQSDYTEAKKCFSLAIQELLKHDGSKQYTHAIALCYNNIGCCYVDTNNDSKALVYFNKAVESYNGYVLAYQNQIRLYQRSFDYEETIEICDKILSISNDPETILLAKQDKFEAEFESTDYDGYSPDSLQKARDILDQLKLEHPSNYFSYSGLATLYCSMNDISSAIKELLDGVDNVVDDKWGTAVLLEYLVNFSQVTNDLTLFDKYTYEDIIRANTVVDYGYLERID